MKANFTSFLFILLLLATKQVAMAQTTITQWNFNSSLTAPSTGAGQLTAIGGVTTASGSGTANGGSSDPATTGNTALQTTGYPAATAANRTAGVQFAVSTAGFQNIVVSYDLRHSGTSSRYELLQYTTNITAATPTWVEAGTSDGNAGDTWFNNRSFDLSAIAALNNNPNAGFRVVSTFAPAGTAYAASGPNSTYAAGGTWRFDMITVRTAAPQATPANVAFATVKTTVSESAATVNISAVLTNGNSSPSSVGLEILPISTATSGTDFTVPTPFTLSWPANSSGITATATIAINNDALAENAEYFIVRLVNPVNVVLPAAASNHHTVMITDDDRQAPMASQNISLNYLTSFSNGTAGTNSAEIVAHDPGTQRLFIANSIGSKIDIVNFSNPATATLIGSISMAPYGNINSLAVRNGVVASAVENSNPQQPGSVVFFNTNGTFISQVTVGAMPDMITFTPDGTKVLTANEGEPNLAYTTDPEGSVSIINISGGVANLTQAAVSTAGFAGFNGQAASLKAAGVRIFGYNNPSVAQDLEPEYITFSADGATAYVACQENNALAVVNVATASIISIRALGSKDHSLAANALDVSDQGSAVELANWPIKGLFMPDAIASYTVGGQTYIVTANEGDSREFSPYVEAVRLGTASYVLDSVSFPYRDALKANLGRLNVTTASGDTDGDGDFDEIYAFGGRSISIWNASTGALVWDSGQDMELITSKHPQFAAIFNASNANNTFKNRSDDKGPEPEGVTVAEIGGRHFAFVTLERMGGCIVYDITNPASPVFVDYKNSRSTTSYSGDQGPEGIIYISAANSPTGVPIVILANEVSSTLSIYTVNTAALDISLGKISAHNTGSRHLVQWNTLGEESGDIFELERSRNGQHFSYLATLAAKGTASSYSYTDETPYDGITYYRLKLKHTSGRVTYSAIATASVAGAATAVQVYPNPVKDQFTINAGVLPAIKVIATLTDLRGSVLKVIPIAGSQTSVDVSTLPAGTYWLRFTGGIPTEPVKMSKL